jgi:hypothetical protein
MTLRQFFKLIACPLIAGIFLSAAQLPWKADAFVNRHPNDSRESDDAYPRSSSAMGEPREFSSGLEALHSWEPSREQKALRRLLVSTTWGCGTACLANLY